MVIYAKELPGAVLHHGRTLLDGDALWCNWSCAGVTVRFRGGLLRARLRSVPETLMSPFQEAEPLQPVLAVRADGAAALSLREKLPGGEDWHTLFTGEAGEHSVTLYKLSENVMGKLGLLALETDGEFLPPPPPKARRLEVVGDSITCGYGNETAEPGFRTEDENGLLAYGALAAAELGAEYSAVAVSGCSVAEPTVFPGLQNRGMETMYRYTDAPYERLLGREPALRWDFSACPNDAVVLNLGTNDAMEVKLRGFAPEAFGDFRARYQALLTEIRALNGPDTLILCTLAPMDYFLWDDIRDAVDEYIARSGDLRVLRKKLGGIVSFTEGLGADTHPSAATHARLGRELAALLRPYFA